MFNRYSDKLLVKQKTQETWKKYNNSRKSTSGATEPWVTSARGSDTPGVTSPEIPAPIDGDEQTTPVKPMISVSEQLKSRSRTAKSYTTSSMPTK
jgi:hypothetical protein